MSEPVLYIFMRSDLGMSAGKMVAQAVHAAKMVEGAGPHTACVVLDVSSEGDFPDGAHVVRDAGRTEVSQGTATCAAVLSTKGSFRGYSTLKRLTSVL